MRTITTDLIVETGGKAVVNMPLPSDIKYGKYRAVIVIEDKPMTAKKNKQNIRLPEFAAGLVNGNLHLEERISMGLMDDNRKVFIDTNILIYASLKESPFHHASKNCLENLQKQDVVLVISRQVLR